MKPNLFTLSLHVTQLENVSRLSGPFPNFNENKRRGDNELLTHSANCETIFRSIKLFWGIPIPKIFFAIQYE